MNLKTYEDEYGPDYERTYEAIEDATLSDGLSDYIDVLIPIFNKRLPSFSFLAYSERVNYETCKHFVKCMTPKSLKVEFYAEISSSHSKYISFEIRLCKHDRCAMIGSNILSNKGIIVRGETSELPMMLEALLQALNDSFVEMKGYCFPVASPPTDTKRVLIFSPYYFVYYDSKGTVRHDYSNLPFKLATTQDSVLGIYSLIALSQEVSDKIERVDKHAEDVARYIEVNRAPDSITMSCITKFLRKEYAKPFQGDKGSVAHLKWIEEQFKKAFNVRVC
ncbi:hypothetical protein OH460_08035 [Vibrio sp. Makdt]|uniref:hypothetical protein n=1 Tax=Vibrio sp. Makdt TaxID=2998828 RepID=UPI0022CD295E|nr:hypothetical protein [Vibrio sp. Makdt]MDA0152247.1 hypothetical protein [Vibrio sp. Makdt]